MTGASTALLRSLGGPVEVHSSGFMNHGAGQWFALISAVDFLGVDEDITLKRNTFVDNQPEEGFVFTTQGTLTMTENLLVENSSTQDDDADIVYAGGGNVWIDTWAEDAIAAQFEDEVTDITDPGWDEDFDRTNCDDRPYLAPDSPVLGIGAYGTRDEGEDVQLEPGDTWVRGGCSPLGGVAGGAPWVFGLLLLRRRGRLSE
ncbi:MAG: hypothetical protein GY884_22865 [Proteobacteria bacterium]|nr:hypothetical protein [Pseudomonadota bacterium]